MRRLVSTLWLAAAPLVYANGLIVYKAEGGIRFAEAANLKVNDKDKGLLLGAEPKLTGPANKLPASHLEGTLLKDGSTGVVAVWRQGPKYLLPSGLPKGASAEPQDVWKNSELTYRKSQADKTPVTLAGQDFVAYLPEGVEGLAGLCTDVQALGFLGGKDGYFPVQKQLMAAAVAAYGTAPEMAPLERYVRETMKTDLDRFDTGMESAK